MKILTFGSCLSRYIAHSIMKMRPDAEIIGSVYHNRIDRFVDTYVDKTEQELPHEWIDRLKFKPEMEKDARAIIENQYLSGTLGKHLLNANALGFMSGIASADLILMDNFMDMCAFTLRPIGGGPQIFFNDKATENAREFLEPVGFVDVTVAARKWERLVEWVRAQNPTAQIVFTNFPCRHHTNPVIARRTDEFASAFNSDKCFVHPVVTIPKDDQIQGTLSHFTKRRYDMYAIVILTMTDHDFKLTEEEEVLWDAAALCEAADVAMPE